MSRVFLKNLDLFSRCVIRRRAAAYCYQKQQRAVEGAGPYVPQITAPQNQTAMAGSDELRCGCPRQPLIKRFAARSTTPAPQCSDTHLWAGDSHATRPAGLCRAQPPKAALSAEQCSHWLGMTMQPLSRCKRGASAHPLSRLGRQLSPRESLCQSASS